MGSAQSARRIQPGGGPGRAGGPADLSRSPFLPTPPPALPPPLGALPSVSGRRRAAAWVCLGYYGVLAIFIWLAKMSLGVDWHILPWASFPLVCLVLTLMATRAILKDEALVRAADRIR